MTGSARTCGAAGIVQEEQAGIPDGCLPETGDIY